MAQSPYNVSFYSIDYGETSLRDEAAWVVMLTFTRCSSPSSLATFKVYSAHASGSVTNEMLLTLGNLCLGKAFVAARKVLVLAASVQT